MVTGMAWYMIRYNMVQSWLQAGSVVDRESTSFSETRPSCLIFFFFFLVLLPLKSNYLREPDYHERMHSNVEVRNKRLVQIHAGDPVVSPPFKTTARP